MRPLTIKRAKFQPAPFLTALHQFSLVRGGDGNPLPVVVGNLVHHDPIELAEALADESDEEITDIPDDSLARLESGLTLFGHFAMFDGFDGLDCADGKRVRMRNADEDADECLSFGFVISLLGDTVEIEGRGLSDVSGECELEQMTTRNRISGPMRRWVRSFLVAKKQ